MQFTGRKFSQVFGCQHKRFDITGNVDSTISKISTMQIIFYEPPLALVATLDFKRFYPLVQF